MDCPPKKIAVVGGDGGRGVAVSGEVVVSGVSSVPTPYLVCLEVKTFAIQTHYVYVRKITLPPVVCCQ